MNIGIIGSGIVGKTLAQGMFKHGHSVMIGTRSVSNLEEWSKSKGMGIAVSGVLKAVEFSDLLILAVKGEIAEQVMSSMDSELLNGKTIIDATNPIDSTNPPKNGVIQFFTDSKESLMERLQHAAPAANFVKAFNSIGSAHMVDPKFEATPTMFICGNNDDAKSQAADLLESIGWEVCDLGSATSAGVIEQLCVLWCIPGMLSNKWNHAFRLMSND